MHPDVDRIEWTTYDATKETCGEEGKGQFERERGRGRGRGRDSLRGGGGGGGGGGGDSLRVRGVGWRVSGKGWEGLGGQTKKGHKGKAQKTTWKLRDS